MLSNEDLLAISNILDEKNIPIYQRLDKLESNMNEMKSNINELKNKVTSIDLTLENETNRNIKIIAEGHRDLKRKLDEALRVESEKELMLLRMNVVENDIRKIKEKISNKA